MIQIDMNCADNLTVRKISFDGRDASTNRHPGSKRKIKHLAYRFLHQPCIQDCQSWEAPIHHQFHHPSRQAFWHQGLGCSEVCPSPAELKTRIFTWSQNRMFFYGKLLVANSRSSLMWVNPVHDRIHHPDTNSHCSWSWSNKCCWQHK